MGDKDFESIFAIVNEAPDRIGCMIASTPTGRRGMFYKTCTQMKLNQDVKMNKNNVYDMRSYNRTLSEGWAEFYFPTMVNPECNLRWNVSYANYSQKQLMSMRYLQSLVQRWLGCSTRITLTKLQALVTTTLHHQLMISYCNRY